MKAIAAQADVYAACRMGELVEAALDGHCCTVFAFGQTGSGKTHTLVGNGGSDDGARPEAGPEDGLLARAVAHAFRKIEARYGFPPSTPTVACTTSR
jgi:hypothetical protein